MKNLKTYEDFMNESAIEIVYYEEVIDNWGRKESSQKTDVITKLLQTPEEWSDDQTFEDKLGKPYFIDDLIGKTVKVGTKTFKVEESVVNEAKDPRDIAEDLIYLAAEYDHPDTTPNMSSINMWEADLEGLVIDLANELEGKDKTDFEKEAAKILKKNGI
jgi:hypothetical protein